MLKEFFTKTVTGLLFFTLIFAFTSYPQSVVAVENDLSAQLELLSKEMISLGDVIMKSTSLTDEKRFELMTQLVLISKEILNLKSVVAKHPTSPAVTKVTAAEAGLKKVLIKYDVTTNLAKTEIVYRNKVESKTYDLPGVKLASDYKVKISNLRQEIIKDLSNNSNIIEKDIKDLLMLSSRNPMRDSYIPQNSSIAQKLIQDFGQNSIINKVVVSPGSKSGTIEFFTDQDESVKFSLAKDFVFDGDSLMTEKDTYNFKFELFASTSVDRTYDIDNDGKFYLKPKLILTQTGAQKSEIIKELTSLFNQVPFTSVVPRFGEKIIDFLTAHSAYYFTSYPEIVTEVDRDCYNASDKVIVKEFIRYLAEGLKSQNTEIEAATIFLAPLKVETEYTVSPKCEFKTRIF